MIEVLAVLGFPLAGALALAAIGERREAAAVNVAASLLTFIAAAALTLRVIADGPLLVLDRQFFVDSFNVFTFPVVLGQGKRLFGEGTVPASMKLSSSEVTSQGAVFAVYEPAGALVQQTVAIEDGREVVV